MAISDLGRILVAIGLFISLLGGFFWIGGKLDLPIGKLPGDFQFERGGLSCIVPLASSLLLSILLTVLLNVILRSLNR